MIAKMELIKEIDGMLHDLRAPLSALAAQYGWTENMREFWYKYYADLRERVATGGKAVNTDFTVIVGLNMNGLDTGPISERALKISGMLRDVTGHKVGSSNYGRFLWE